MRGRSSGRAPDALAATLLAPGSGFVAVAFLAAGANWGFGSALVFSAIAPVFVRLPRSWPPSALVPQSSSVTVLPGAWA